MKTATMFLLFLLFLLWRLIQTAILLPLALLVMPVIFLIEWVHDCLVSFWNEFNQWRNDRA